MVAGVQHRRAQPGWLHRGSSPTTLWPRRQTRMSDHQHRGPRLYAFMICERCYYECQKSLTKYPDHPCQHIGSPQILATRYRSQLVRVRPFPAHTADNLASRNMWFGLCVHGSRCRGAKCTFAHSLAERDFWNTELADRRWPPRTLTRVRPPPTPPTAHWPCPEFFSSASNQAPSVS